MLMLGVNIRCDYNFNIYQLTFKNLNFVYFHFIFIQNFNYNFRPIISSMNGTKVKWLVIEHLVYNYFLLIQSTSVFMGTKIKFTKLEGTPTNFLIIQNK